MRASRSSSPGGMVRRYLPDRLPDTNYIGGAKETDWPQGGASPGAGRRAARARDALPSAGDADPCPDLGGTRLSGIVAGSPAPGRLVSGRPSIPGPAPPAGAAAGVAAGRAERP